LKKPTLHKDTFGVRGEPLEVVAASEPNEMSLDILAIASAAKSRAIGPQWGFEVTEDNPMLDDLGPIPKFDFVIQEDAAYSIPGFSEVTPEQALNALDNMDDYSRMECGIIPKGDAAVLFQFILQNMKVFDPEDEHTQRIINFFTKEYLK